MRDRLVTLTTDVGWAYAAQMKGVLSRSLSPGRLVDIAHDLPPHGIEEAAFLLRHIGPTFPAGTVHLAVVDPGVGGKRAPIAVECEEGSFLVGPDNGLLAPLAEFWGIRRVVRLDPRRVAGSGRVSATFEGRDLFAPAAARLAGGARISALGSAGSLTRLAWPPLVVRDTEVRGRIQHVDRFGNLITDIPAELGPPVGTRVGVRFRAGPTRRLPRKRIYEEGAVGEGMLLISSFGLLEVSVREGNAARRYRARSGDRIAIGRTAVRYR